MWVWEHALFNYNPKRPDSTKKDKTVEVITKADHDAALRRAKAEGVREASEIADQVHTALWTPPQRACCSGTAAHIKALIDARAAQIEEGA